MYNVSKKLIQTAALTVCMGMMITTGTPVVSGDHNHNDGNQTVVVEELEETAATETKTDMSISDEEIELLARAVYSEARGEPFHGQVAIAAVILNRVEHDDFPCTIGDVIFQPSAFTAVSDGQFWLSPDCQAYRAVAEALAGKDPSGGAIYYYNPVTATSHWIFSRQIIATIGKHVFAI